MDTQLSTLLMVVAPVVLVLVQFLKSLNISSNFLPLLAIIIGCITGSLVSGILFSNFGLGAVYGALAGATTTAGFASVKNTLAGYKEIMAPNNEMLDKTDKTI